MSFILGKIFQLVKPDVERKSNLDIVQELQAKLRQNQSKTEQLWISTAERLPAENQFCFWIPTSGEVFVGFYRDNAFWRHGGRYTKNVVHWWCRIDYPLPVPKIP